MTDDWMGAAADQALARILDRLSPRFAERPYDRAVFEERCRTHFPRLFSLLHRLYGWQYDFFWHLEQVMAVTAEAFLSRPEDLHRLDAHRQPDWFEDHQVVGAVCYVDRFAGSITRLRKRLSYLQELDITYLHLMPPYAVPEGPDDGGYAVSDYRRVDPAIGTIKELAAFASELRRSGVVLALDLVLNHTADTHPWAERAKQGDPDFQSYYWMFDDRSIPERFLPNLRESFPDREGDVFTWRADVSGPRGGKWVWSTFHTYQWDLNYRNPMVLTAMAGEMLFLANLGAEVLRMDATPFLWKEMGTSCENLPETHLVLQALNAVAALAAPGLTFTSEAHPDDVALFLGPHECRIAYNPLIMALLWESLAARNTKLLADSLRHRLTLPTGAGWVNYLRDDIGWTFADEDAVALGIDPARHRSFLNSFYTGRFPGSFARGLSFQRNPGDARISGTLASLAGLEAASTREEESMAIRRILVLYGLMVSLPGIPLICLGDEIGQLNDYAFAHQPAIAHDNRWAHRPVFDADRLTEARTGGGPLADLFNGIHRLLDLRRSEAAFAGHELGVIDLSSPHLIGFVRRNGDRHVVIVANLSEHTITLPALGSPLTDLLTGAAHSGHEELTMGPYAFHALLEG